MIRRSGTPIFAIIALLFSAYCLGAALSSDWSVVAYREPVGHARFFQELFIQGAMAILLALIVYEIAERAYARRKAQSDREAAEKTLSGVVKNLYGEFFDSDTIAGVTKTIFSSPLVREPLVITYIFENHETSKRLIRLRVVCEYVLKNASPFPQPMPIAIMLSNLMANHPSDPCAEKSRLVYFSMNKKELTQDELSDLNSRIDPATGTVSLLITKGELEPAGEFSVRSEIETLKLENDSEVMQLIRPAKKVEVHVENNTDKDLCINLKSIHSREFQDRETVSLKRKWYKWEHSEVFLNHNGWTLYWTNLGTNLSD